MAAIRVRCSSNLGAKFHPEPPGNRPRPSVLALGSRRRRRHPSEPLVARNPRVAPERRKDRRPTPRVDPAEEEEAQNLKKREEELAASEAEESVIVSERQGDRRSPLPAAGESGEEAVSFRAGRAAERIGGSRRDDGLLALGREEEELNKTIASFILGETESTDSALSEHGNAYRQHAFVAEVIEEVSDADEIFKEEKVSTSSSAAATNGVEQNGNQQVLVTGIVLDNGTEEATTLSTLLVNMDDETEGQNEDSVSPTVLPDVEEDAESTEKDEQKQNKKTFSVVFVSSEAAPYSKTGGLGDVCGSLPIALASRGHRVMVISPRYLNGISNKNFAGAFDLQVRIKLPCFGGEQEVAFFHEYRAGVDWVFVDHPSYHRPGNPYGDGDGAFGDNQFRYTLLCYAACEAPLVLPLGGYTYGQNCLFVVNDWHAGLVPILLSAKYRPYGVYRDARSILVIHNLAHQGVEPATTYEYLGLPPEWYGALEWVFPTWARRHALDKGEAVNILKGAIVTSDRIVTVSQGYAWEITTVEGGQGLDEILANRKSVINGITNGIDIDDWNPATDKHIPHHYSVEDLSGKAQCKAALQKELGLPVRDNCPMIGFIGRLDYQKGTDMFSLAVPELLQDDVQFVMLGSGDKDTENWMKWTEATYRDKFRGWVGFNIPISHRITAGCDILLMPSRFEPCGLNQLYAMRYGTIPVVNCTGGLRDTVETFNPFANEGRGEGTGWRFSPLSKEAMIQALKMAIRTFKDHKSSWEGIMKRGMMKDFTWDAAAVQYEKIFEWTSIDPPYIR